MERKRTPDYALFLKGPRRVGKSTLTNKLGREQYKSYIEIRFDKVPEKIKNLFINFIEDLDDMFVLLKRIPNRFPYLFGFEYTYLIDSHDSGSYLSFE